MHLLLQQPPIIPVTGASSVAQLEELLGAVDLRLDGAQGPGVLSICPLHP
jgi:aryl-alcohol dehydrogenase-like predicted oxidoreductase